ncbi:MAG: lipopolysaccharide biosynthesis protein [Phycisphaerae bacterium]
MSTHTLRHRAINGVVWKGAETLGRQGIQFVVSVILARLLAPEQFGLIAMLLIFTQIAQVFVDSGFATALIQKKNTDIKDESSVFFLNIAVSILVYVILCLSSGVISRFYGEPVLGRILPLIAISIIIRAFGQIQRTLLRKNIDFKSQAKVGIISVVVSGAVGIYMAYAGCGVWALVYQQITMALAETITFWCVSKWRPQMIFCWKSVTQLFGFGSKLLVSGLIDRVFVNIYGLIIGKLFAPADLGFYDRGRALPQLAMTSVNGTLMAVMFPVFSSMQDDRVRLKQAARKTLTISCFAIFPLMFGLVAVAEPLVRVLLTDKWLPCVPYLQIMCFVYVTWPIHVANLQILNAIGRSDIFLKLEIIKKINITIAILVTFKFGVLAMVWGQLATAAISVFLNSYYSGKFIGYKTSDQLKDISASCLLALFMAFVVCLAGLLAWPNIYVQLVCQVLLGVAVYIAGGKAMKLRALTETVDIVKGVFNSKINALHLTKDVQSDEELK